MSTNSWRPWVVLLVLAWIAAGQRAFAQRGNSASSGSSGSASAAAPSAGLAGLSYDQAHWKSDLSLPRIPSDKRVVTCYQLAYGASIAQPFVLTPVRVISLEDATTANQPFCAACTTTAEPDQDPAMKEWCSRHSKGCWTPCSLIDNEHPILMGQTLVIGIDPTSVSRERLKILNLNVTTVQGTPINPTPVRPSFSATGGYVALGGGGELYMTWPNSLPGDTLATVSVNLVYTPPAQGERWSRQTYYPVGSVVTSSRMDGHFYTAVGAGVSGTVEPVFQIALPSAIIDGDIVWADAGPAGAAASGKAPGVWLPTHAFNQGDAIVDPYNGHAYLSTSADKSKTGAATSEPFSLPTPSAGTVQTAAAPREVSDGSIHWLAQPPSQVCNNKWLPNHAYSNGNTVGPYNGLCYSADAAGISGAPPIQPYFPASGPATVRESLSASNKLEWLDSGVIPPSTVASGQASDQVVNLLNLQLPQTHAKSYYNLAAGIVYSSVRTRTFGIPPGTTNTSGEVQTSSNPTIDPVLLFTFYPWPSDTESHCSFATCFRQTAPGFNFGVSLTSPGSNYYGGVTIEVLRNVQFVAGGTWAKSAELPKQAINLPSNATAAITIQKFKLGAFAGLTFNISGFIQSLFSGGGGGGSAKSGAGQ
jgi:hypothetical protein